MKIQAKRLLPLPKIRYRLVFNYANRLNRSGMAPVALECRQGKRRIYVSSKVSIRPFQWRNGVVTNHPNARKLTVYLYRWLHDIEDIELNYILEGHSMTLSQLRNAIRSDTHPKATISEFVNSVIIGDTSRCESTKHAYVYLAREIEREFGRMTIEDITYDFIIRYRDFLRHRNLSENTVKGRLKTLRALVSEALKRDIIVTDPFRNVTIGNMTPRLEHLSAGEIRSLERVRLEGRAAHIRDAFLFCCFTGLRFSDFTNLKDENIAGGMLSLRQQKTRGTVKIPLRHLFGGKPMEILSRYENVRYFACIGHNSTANKQLKDIARMAGITKNVHWHTSRHSCGTLLNQAGLRMQEIQKILGHSNMEVTSKTYAETTTRQLDASLRKAFKT